MVVLSRSTAPEADAFGFLLRTEDIGEDLFVRNSGQEDSNLAAEIAEFGPVPTNPLFDSQIQDRYPGDACDPNPITVLDPTAGDFAPVGNPRALACTEHPGFFCEGPFVSDGQCELSRDNVIVTPGLTRAAGGESATLNAITRLVACACADGVPPDQCESTTCPRTNVLMPSAAWSTMSMFDVRFPTTPLNRRSGTPVPLPTPFINTLHVPVDLYAHSRSLG
jgi:hypothetical protein